MGLGGQTYFITNTDELLQDVISNALRVSERVDILVGYFLLSGLSKLNKSHALEGKKVRILVGMRARLNPDGGEVEEVQCKTCSVKERRDFFQGEMLRTMNAADDYDEAQMSEGLRILQAMRQRGDLEIRLTREACHAKLYVFHYNATVRASGQPGVAIMGSSNLSTAGLGGRLEINRRFADNEAYEAGSKIFEALWEESEVLVDETTPEEFSREVLDKTWLGKLYSPYEFYLRVLDEYFSRKGQEKVLKPSDVNSSYADLQYQTDAIAMAKRSLQLYRGVMLADVVGLGKSVIAACVARSMDNMHVTVICPPHLVPQWREYGSVFSLLGLRVFSSGALHKVFEEHSAYADAHAERLIIVDEAHRFRNSATESYSLLHKICARNRVMLLTATPFNNRPSDVYSLVRLFQSPSSPTLPGVSRLDITFETLQKEYDELRSSNEVIPDKEKVEEIGRKLRDVIAPVVIRRSRVDLQRIEEYRDDLARQGYKPLTPEAPIAHGYAFHGLEELYRWTIARITPVDNDCEGAEELSYQAVRYAPLNYVRPESREELKKELAKHGWDMNRLRQQQGDIVAILRRMLVRRFESSVAAFKLSLETFIEGYEETIKLFDEGEVELQQTIRKEVAQQSEGESELDSAAEEASGRVIGKVKHKVPSSYFTQEFRDLMQNDLSILQDVRAQWESQLPENAKEPKMQEFMRLLRKMLDERPARKVVVFSEFADTVNALARVLKKEGFAVQSYTSSTPERREEVLKAFDASSKEVKKGADRVLVTTDALSEGVNLNLADTVFNYDIPYNPTRVVQRVGRINRINQRVHDRLYIHNFFPSYIGEEQVSVGLIARLKVAFMKAVLGDDTKILDPDEVIRSFGARVGDEIAGELRQEDVESWDTPYRVELAAARSTEAFERALKIPTNARTARRTRQGGQAGVLLYGRSGSESRFSFAPLWGEARQIGAQDAFSLFKAQASGEHLSSLSDGFSSRYALAREALFFKEPLLPSISRQEVEARGRVRKAIEELEKAAEPGRQGEVNYLKYLEVALEHRALSSKDFAAVQRVNFGESDPLKELRERLPVTILQRIVESAFA